MHSWALTLQDGEKICANLSKKSNDYNDTADFAIFAEAFS